MEQKTKVSAEDGRQEISIIRDFDLPRELLFEAYTDADLFAQWMGTKVLKLECRVHGAYRFETSDAKGKVALTAHGVIHAFVPGERITRTFEMENTSYGIQLEFLEFEMVDEERSRLHMHIIYRSIAHRDRMLALPFAYGLNRAHDRLQEVLSNRIAKKSG